jgi:hypothetical protein
MWSKKRNAKSTRLTVRCLTLVRRRQVTKIDY